MSQLPPRHPHLTPPLAPYSQELAGVLSSQEALQQAADQRVHGLQQQLEHLQQQLADSHAHSLKPSEASTFAAEPQGDEGAVQPAAAEVPSQAEGVKEAAAAAAERMEQEAQVVQLKVRGAAS